MLAALSALSVAEEAKVLGFCVHFWVWAVAGLPAVERLEVMSSLVHFSLVHFSLQRGAAVSAAEKLGVMDLAVRY